MPGLKLSFTNLVAAAGACAFGSIEDATFVACYAQEPERPFVPWRAPTTCEASLHVDLGSSQTLELIALVNANFTACVKIQGSSSCGFGTLSYNQTVTLTRNPWNWRYQHVHLPTGFGYQHLRVLIPSQTPVPAVAGTTSTYYSLGGIWAGALSTSPDGLSVNPQFRTVLPREDVSPSHGGWRQRLQLGEPLVRIDASLPVHTCTASPADGDDLDTWLDLQRQSWQADYHFCYLNLGDLAQGWVVRSLEDATWEVAAGVSRGSLLLEEVIGP